MLTSISQTDLLGIAPYQIFRVAWLQREFTVLDLGFRFPAQPTGVIRRARSTPSAIAQYAINELCHAACQAGWSNQSEALLAVTSPGQVAEHAVAVIACRSRIRNANDGGHDRL
jgi:hypothetical protein